MGHGDLTHLAAGWNELSDGRGNAYVNQAGFDLMAGAEPTTGSVAEGGQVPQTVSLDRGCFSCALGGPQGRTLFIAATQWHGPEHMFQGERTGQIVAIDVSIPAPATP